MGTLLARLGLRGVAVVGIAIVVLAVVGVARLANRGGGAPPYTPVVPVTNSVEPTTGDDGVVAIPSAFPDDVQVIGAAEAFTQAWLQRDTTATEWLAALTPLVTAPLAESLQGVDPIGVPATRTLGPPTIKIRSATNAQTSTSVDTGTLILGLTKEQGRWLIESVDWDRT